MPPMKPGMWAVTPGMVAPEWRGLWRDLIILVPFWDGSPAPTFNYAPAGQVETPIVLAWTGTPVSAVTQTGLGVAGSGANELHLDNTTQMTIGDVVNSGWSSLVVREVTTASVDSGLLGWNGGYQLWLDANGGNLRYGLQLSDGIIYSDNIPSPLNRPLVVLQNNRVSDVAADVWLNGDLFYTHSGGDWGPAVGSRYPEWGGYATTKAMNGSLSFVAFWNRELTDAEARLVTTDPFGLIRMDSGPEVWAAAGTPFTLTPNSDGTITAVFNELHAITNLYQSVDDDPDTPTLTDWNTSGEADGNTFYQLSATPGDFDSILNPLTVRADVGSTDFGADTAVLYAQVFAANESTTYTDEVQVATQTSSGLVTADLTVNATGLAASKTAWDAARLRLRWDYTA